MMNMYLYVNSQSPPTLRSLNLQWSLLRPLQVAIKTLSVNLTDLMEGESQLRRVGGPLQDQGQPRHSEQKQSFKLREPGRYRELRSYLYIYTHIEYVHIYPTYSPKTIVQVT